MGSPHVAKAIREAVGFGAVDVLPAIAADNGHRGMINAPSLRITSAYADLTNAITWGEDPTAARQAVEDARQAIVEAIVELLPGMGDHIPPVPSENSIRDRFNVSAVLV